jgi:hypothetical protein
MELGARNRPRSARGRCREARNDFAIADIGNHAYGHLADDCGFPLAGFPAIARWADRVAGIIGPGHPIIPYGPEARPA